MKSKTLSFNCHTSEKSCRRAGSAGMVKETWKRQLWVFAVSCLVYFLNYPVKGLLAFNRWSAYKELQKEPDALKRIFFHTLYGTPAGNGGDLPMLLCMAALLGIVCAVSSFSYLHSRNKVDFYHSLPVKREKLFLYQMLASVINYLIPAAVGMLLLMGVGAVKGAWTPAAFGAGLASVLVGLVIFLMSFALAALAMMLTGRILVGILGILVFFGYSCYLYLLGEMYGDWFFDTYYSSTMKVNGELWQFATPLGWAEKIGNSLNGGEGWMLTLAAFVFTLLLLVLCIWVYKMRPAEAAGNSMAFSAAGEVIKVLLVSSAALGMGIVFISLVESGRDGWFVFGLIFGLLLFYAVVQMIYYMDIKKLWKGKWQLLCSAALVGIVALVCRLDLLGYDTYLPKQDSIKNINIISNGGFIEDSGYWDGDESSLNRIEMGCDDSLYQNVREIIAASEKYWADYKQSSREDTESTITFAMKYEKKNGRCGYRIYTVYFKDVADVMKQLCNRSEYLDNLYPIRTAAAEDVQSMEILTKHAYGEEVYSEKDKARFRLVEALQKDMENLDGETIEKEIPLARISYGLYRPDEDTDITPLALELQNLGENYMYGYEYYYCYVYPSFVNTIAVLKEAGYDLTEKTTAADVKKIRITNTENDFYENVDYTDEAEIEELLDALVFSPLATEWYDYEDSCTAQVFWKDGGAEEDSSYWLLRTDKLPEFLKEQT